MRQYVNTGGRKHSEARDFIVRHRYGGSAAVARNTANTFCS
jgi:hypothetical protein